YVSVNDSHMLRLAPEPARQERQQGALAGVNLADDHDRGLFRKIRQFPGQSSAYLHLRHLTSRIRSYLIHIFHNPRGSYKEGEPFLGFRGKYRWQPTYKPLVVIVIMRKTSHALLHCNI